MWLKVACGLIWWCSAKVCVFLGVLYHFPQPSLTGFGFGVGVGGLLKWIIGLVVVCSG